MIDLEDLKSNVLPIAAGLLVILLILAIVATVAVVAYRPPAGAPHAATITPSSLPSPLPTPATTATPTPAPTAIPEPIESPSTDAPAGLAYPDDGSYSALQQLADWGMRYGQQSNTAQSTIGIAGEDQTQTSSYPWVRYGFNDSLPRNLSFMWHPEKFRTVANSEADRYTMYQHWLDSVTPHHDVTGKIELLDGAGNVINYYNNALIVDSMVGARFVLMNNQPGDPIARIDYRVELRKYNPGTESLELIYADNDTGITIGLVPGQSWTKEITRQIPLLPGRWKAFVWVYNHDDDILLCEPTITADVVIDHGNGIISYG